MKAFGRFLIVLLLLGNLAYMGALSLHVVQSPAGTALVPKGQTSLLETLVDTRPWTPSDLREHASLVTDINRAGKGNLIAHVGNVTTTVTPQPVAPQSVSVQKSPEKQAAPAAETPDKSIFDFTK